MGKFEETWNSRKNPSDSLWIHYGFPVAGYGYALLTPQCYVPKTFRPLPNSHNVIANSPHCSVVLVWNWNTLFRMRV